MRTSDLPHRPGPRLEHIETGSPPRGRRNDREPHHELALPDTELLRSSQPRGVSQVTAPDQLRQLIDPFFKLLGWDIDNGKRATEQYRQVIHEDAIKICGVTKASDYAFRIGGVAKFSVEAKKASVNLREDAPAAFRLRRYAWTGCLRGQGKEEAGDGQSLCVRVRRSISDSAGCSRKSTTGTTLGSSTSRQRRAGRSPIN